MYKKTISCLVFLFLALMFSMSASAQSAGYEAEIRALEPEAAKILPGVFVATEGPRHTIHTFGKSGMRFTLQRIEMMLDRPNFANENPAGFQDLMDIRTSIQAALNQSSKKAKKGSPSIQVEESGTACLAIPYELEAYATQGFWEVGASASAGFQQWGGGPQIPGNGTVSAYTEVFMDDGSQSGWTGTNSDSKTESLNGFSWIEAGPVSRSTGFAGTNCMKAKAIAIFSYDCDGGQFRSAFEETSQYCD